MPGLYLHLIEYKQNDPATIEFLGSIHLRFEFCTEPKPPKVVPYIYENEHDARQLGTATARLCSLRHTLKRNFGRIRRISAIRLRYSESDS